MWKLGGHISLGQKKTDVSIPVHSHIRHHDAVPLTSPFMNMSPAFIRLISMTVHSLSRERVPRTSYILHVEQECLIGIIIRTFLTHDPGFRPRQAVPFSPGGIIHQKSVVGEMQSQVLSPYIRMSVRALLQITVKYRQANTAAWAVWFPFSLRRKHQARPA